MDTEAKLEALHKAINEAEDRVSRLVEKVTESEDEDEVYEARMEMEQARTERQEAWDALNAFENEIG